MTKTYYPTAVIVADKAHKYLTRYQSTLTINATPGQVTALVSLVACLAQFLAEWVKMPPQP